MNKSAAIFCTIVLLLVGWSCPLNGQSPQRVALVIGNSEYSEGGRLQNPTNDADAIARALASIGFSVTKKKDRTKSQIEDDVDMLTKTLSKGDLCLIFFAGHGMQIRSENYLVPIGATITREHHVRQRCVSVSYILDAMDFSDASLKVVILDCCRDNPFRGFTRGRSGFAKLESAPEGTIVSFSAAPGRVALDGAGTNSPFTECLVEALESESEHGLEIFQLFRTASQAVEKKIGQRPYLELDATIPNYYLKQPAKPQKPVQALMQTDSLRMLQMFGDGKISREYFDLWKALDAKQHLNVEEQAQWNCFQRLLDDAVTLVEFNVSLERLSKRDLDQKTLKDFQPLAENVPPSIQQRTLPIPADWKTLKSQTVYNYMDYNLDQVEELDLDLNFLYEFSLKVNEFNSESVKSDPLTVFNQDLSLTASSWQGGFGKLNIEELAKINERSQPGVTPTFNLSQLVNVYYARYVFAQKSESMEAVTRGLQQLPYYEIGGLQYYRFDSRIGEVIAKVEKSGALWQGTPSAFMKPYQFSPNLRKIFASIPKSRFFSLALDLTPYRKLWPENSPPQVRKIDGVTLAISLRDADLLYLVVHGIDDAAAKPLLDQQPMARNSLLNMIDQQIPEGNELFDDAMKEQLKSIVSAARLSHQGNQLIFKVPESQIPVAIDVVEKLTAWLKENESSVLDSIESAMKAAQASQTRNTPK